jgi:hypothetical protein
VLKEEESLCKREAWSTLPFLGKGKTACLLKQGVLVYNKQPFEPFGALLVN